MSQFLLLPDRAFRGSGKHVFFLILFTFRRLRFAQPCHMFLPRWCFSYWLTLYIHRILSPRPLRNGGKVVHTCWISVDFFVILPLPCVPCTLKIFEVAREICRLLPSDWFSSDRATLPADKCCFKRKSQVELSHKRPPTILTDVTLAEDWLAECSHLLSLASIYLKSTVVKHLKFRT